jgi:hypothetical protein
MNADGYTESLLPLYNLSNVLLFNPVLFHLFPNVSHKGKIRTNNYTG